MMDADTYARWLHELASQAIRSGWRLSNIQRNLALAEFVRRNHLDFEHTYTDILHTMTELHSLADSEWEKLISDR